MDLRFLSKLLITIVLFAGNSLLLRAEEPVHPSDLEVHKTDSTHASPSEDHTTPGKEEFDASSMILDHISDGHEWHFFSYTWRDKEHDVVLFLPLVLFSPGNSLNIFSYKHLHHAPHGESYKGYLLDDEHHIVRADGASFYDFSFTRNVIQLLISMLIMLWLFVSVARNYSKYGVKAPRGIQSAIEVIVIFIRDEVAKPMLGAKANKYMPYLLTLFFFIWINNLLGLIPGSANVTGNIAVTATLAALTFIIMMVRSKSHFWLHMINPPGVPLPVKILLVPIEFISNIIIKPFALMIRLFANMLAGHLIILSFMSIIFIFAAMNIVAGLGASVFSVAFSIFIYMLELLVAVLQAYIFTILSALFISETTAEPQHERH